MSQLTELPQEILDKISAEPSLSNSDLGHLRTINKDFCNLVTNRLFCTFTLKFTKNSLNLLEQLSESNLARSVKHLIYSLDAHSYDQGLQMPHHRAKMTY